MMQFPRRLLLVIAAAGVALGSLNAIGVKSYGPATTPRPTPVAPAPLISNRNTFSTALPARPPKEKCKWYHEATFVFKASLGDADRKALDKLLDALVKAIDAASAEVNAVKKAIDDLGPAGDVVDVVLVYACEDDDGNITRRSVSLDNTENIHWAAKAARAPDNAREQSRVIARHVPAGGCCKPKAKTNAGIKGDTKPGATKLIGLIYDKDSQPGEWSTLSVTTDPKQYQKIAGLGVVEMKLSLPADSTAQDLLQSLAVDAGDGRWQPADQPFAVQSANRAKKISVIFSRSSVTYPAQPKTVDAPNTPPAPVTVGEPTRKPSSQHQDGTTVTWHDAQGRTVKVEEYDANSSLQSSTTTEYSSTGEKERETTVYYQPDGRGHTYVKQYDEHGGLTTYNLDAGGKKTDQTTLQRSPEGIREERTFYDPQGRVKEHEIVEKNPDGQMVGGTREKTTYSGDDDREGKSQVEHFNPASGNWEPGPALPKVNPAPSPDKLPIDPSSIVVPLHPSASGPANPMPTTAEPGSFVTPPVVLNTSLIRGPVSGNCNLTQIIIDDKPAVIVAESPRTVYFDLPRDTPPGAHQLAIQDGTNTAVFPIVIMSLSGHIDQPDLIRGQKTNYSVTLNFGSLPASVWQNGGPASELMDPSALRTAANGFHVPQTGEPGVVLLAINNVSRETVHIIPSQNERVFFTLHEQDFQNNQFTTRGEVQSRVSGTFTIDLLAQGFFAPIKGQPLAFSLKTKFCPNLCKAGDTAPAGSVEVAFTPKGYDAGEIDKMASGVKIIRNMPIPGPGKPIRAAAAALIEGAFGFADAVAKKNGQTIWVRVTCYVCEDESCLIWTRKNWVQHKSAWEKVMDLETLTRDGGATLDQNLTMDQIAEAIKDKADGLKCP